MKNKPEVASLQHRSLSYGSISQGVKSEVKIQGTGPMVMFRTFAPEGHGAQIGQEPPDLITPMPSSKKPVEHILGRRPGYCRTCSTLLYDVHPEHPPVRSLVLHCAGVVRHIASLLVF